MGAYWSSPTPVGPEGAQIQTQNTSQNGKSRLSQSAAGQPAQTSISAKTLEASSTMLVAIIASLVLIVVSLIGLARPLQSVNTFGSLSMILLNVISALSLVIASFCGLEMKSKTISDTITTRMFTDRRARYHFIWSIIDNRRRAHQNGYLRLAKIQRTIPQRTSADEPVLWAIDSAANHHCVNSLDLLTDPRTIKPLRLKGIGGHTTASIIGAAIVTLHGADGTVSQLHLNDVLFAPSLPVNVLCAGEMTKAGIECDLFRCKIKRGACVLSEIAMYGNLHLLPYDQHANHANLQDRLSNLVLVMDEEVQHAAEEDAAEEDMVEGETADDLSIDEDERQRLLASYGLAGDPVEQENVEQLLRTISDNQKERFKDIEAAIRISATAEFQQISHTLSMGPVIRKAKNLGRLASGPTESAVRVKAPDPRLLSSASLLTEQVTWQKTSEDRWKKIKQSLQREHLTTEYLQLENFAYLFPNMDTTPAQLETHIRLQRQPMTVSSLELQSVLKLERSTRFSPDGEPGRLYPYIREFAMYTSELARVIELLTDGIEDAAGELEEWQNQIRTYGMKDGVETLFTVRYVGVCVGPRIPYDRFQEDLKRSSGFLSAFISCLGFHMPAILNKATTYTIVDATLEPGFAIPLDLRKVQDDIERVLIDFLGFDTLLNRQRGGAYADYVRPYHDDVLFSNLQTRFWHRLRSNRTDVDEATESRLVNHFMRVQAYMTANPEITGHDYAPYTDTLRDAATYQATPKQYRKTTILVIGGWWYPWDEYYHARGFFNGFSRSAKLTRQLLHGLARCEAEAQKLKWYEQAFRPVDQIAFCDLWQWLKRGDPTESIRFFRDWMSIVRPLIAISLGTGPTAVMRANFEDDLGIGIIRNMTDLAGTATIQSYGAQENDDEDETISDPENAFINIPFIHPGADRYLSHSIRLRRVLDLTWQLTLLYSSTAMDVLDGLAADEQPTRHDLCKMIMDRVSTYLANNRAGIAFQKEFDSAKRELHLDYVSRMSAHYAKQPHYAIRYNARLPSFAMGGSRLILDEEGRRQIGHIGFAAGEANSYQRRVDLQRLWERNLPDLHLMHAHTPEARRAWEDSFLELSEGQSYFFAAISKLRFSDYLEVLVRQCPELHKLTKGLGKDEFRDLIVVQCGFWIRKKLAVDQALKQVAKFPAPWVKTKDLSHTPVGLDSKGIMTVRWERNPDDEVTIELVCSTAVPIKYQESRFLNFNEHGITIVSATGKKFFRVRNPNTATVPSHLATFNLDYINKNCGWRRSTDLYDMWAAVRKYNGYTVPPPPPVQPGARVWGFKKEDGVGCLPHTADHEEPKQYRPPREQDCNYLLVTWIERLFPDGGAFRTANSSVPGSPAHLENFVAFLESPAYAQHPWADYWLGRIRSGRPEVQIFYKNLSLFRSCRKTLVRHTYFDADGKEVELAETVFYLGKPGTASWPFASEPPKDQPFLTGARTRQVIPDNKIAAKGRDWAVGKYPVSSSSGESEVVVLETPPEPAAPGSRHGSTTGPPPSKKRKLEDVVPSSQPTTDQMRRGGSSSGQQQQHMKSSNQTVIPPVPELLAGTRYVPARPMYTQSMNPAAPTVPQLITGTLQSSQASTGAQGIGNLRITGTQQSNQASSSARGVAGVSTEQTCSKCHQVGHFRRDCRAIIRTCKGCLSEVAGQHLANCRRLRRR